jgi:two-component system, OmpR family, sensor kinase
VLVLAGLGMAVTGVTSIAFEQRRMYDRIDAALGADVGEFRAHLDATSATAAASGLNVATILRSALERQVPSVDEVVLGMVDGKPTFVTPGQRPFPIEKESALIAQIAAQSPTDPTRIRSGMTTSVGKIRYAAVHVQVAGRPEQGTFVAAASLRTVRQSVLRSARQYAVLSVGALILIGVGGWIVAGRLLRPLRLLRDAAQRISHTDLTSRIPVTGRDDVTELTDTVNAMLDRLQRTFDAQQQFLDDAGHELRTPLTIVQGNLEVLDPNDAPEVVAIRELVMDELDRMARLVSDLIVLAQAGRPDFVRFEPVDLDRLLNDVLGKVQSLADRNWVLDSNLPVMVLADPQRLTQALLQLADNAVRHTQDHDAIAFGGVESRGRILLWVRDTGTGVAPEDAARIFERFGRAGEFRGDNGSGLGLSIVGGIAAAHGGRVTLESAGLGHGARFTLELPLTVLLSENQRPKAQHAFSAMWERAR